MKTILLALLFSLSVPGIAAEQAPGFNLPSLTGDQNVALNDYKGKVVFVDFWASWCGPCRKSLPLFNKMYAELKDQGFEIIAINLDEDKDEALRFLNSHPVNYTVVRDESGSTPDNYAVRVMPSSFLISRTGELVQRHAGFKVSDMPEIKQMIADQLAKK
ncbi:MAG: TlpA family protein disulfide reductase [bacterium]